MNVLRLPIAKQQKSPLDFFKNFVEEIKTKREIDYQRKVEFLRHHTYNHYLRELLKKQNPETLDFPPFVYITGTAIHTEAQRLTDWAIAEAEKKGKKHIEKCYRLKLERVLRLRAAKRRRILKQISK